MMIKRDVLFASALVAALGAVSAALAADEGCDHVATGKNAIFFHPDGTSAAHWDAMRLLHYGPDGQSNWDRLPEMAAYRGHLSDQMSSTSNAGATIHATGTRTWSGSFGLDEQGNEIVAADGGTNTVMEDAVDCGLATALVQSGSIIEPGTAAFVADAVNRYADAEEIALEVAESGVDILLGAGEEWLLPAGVQGRFGVGVRSDGRNLIDEARERGYAVVYTRDELFALPASQRKVFGVFNVEDTFHDQSEEELRQQGLPLFIESAPSVAEMTRFVLDRLGEAESGFFAVIEEEGSDNFCNKFNAAGCLEALKRADDAIGVISGFVQAHPDTFMVTASDSNANGMLIREFDPDLEVLPGTEPDTGAMLDGAEGKGTKPFVSAPDARGQRFPFGIVWPSSRDTGAGVIARAIGLDAAQRVPATGVSNIDVYWMLHHTLFGEDE